MQLAALRYRFLHITVDLSFELRAPAESECHTRRFDLAR